MKLLARYLYGSGGEVEDDSLALKTFKMFAAFIQAAGDLHDPDKNISMTEKAWLRAVAGSSLLKLCYIQKYSQMVGIDLFATLATLMIDSADCVRSYFVRRLNKGILRNRLTVEYLALFSLTGLVTASSSDEEQAVRMYREQCRGFLISAINRRRSLIQSAGFSPMYLPYHQPEYSVAYSIWLLAQQPMLTTHSDLPSLAALQECLWFVMEAFLAKKENTDFEFIYRLLQDIKESNDAHFEKRRKQGELGQAEVKMWALADLGMLMLTYRAKVTIRHEPRKPLLSSRFFVRDKNTEHSRTVYAPHELIEDEKERNGKLPTDEKRRFLNATSNTSKRGAGASKNTTKLRRGRANTGKEVDRGDVLSSPEITTVSKQTNRKPLQVEQESVAVEEKVKREGKKPPVTPKLSRKRTSSPVNNDIVIGSVSTNGVAKENGKSPRKTRVSSLEQFPDGIDFSPITSTGARVTKGKTRPIPISTSTPMPHIPAKSKAAVRKRTKRDSSSQPTDDLEQQPQQKKPLAPLT
ncbi:unnamed protein product [Heligmosomoides polygyrus]|uniref:WAPL domain-containing protein n=1 Tax=Heligmosomoides polygyrus TaxID=6339 RepID=A0A183G0U5_HELPZ|nr:unnamed protein product [Heligmosomoides polygyrus]